MSETDAGMTNADWLRAASTWCQSDDASTRRMGIAKINEIADDLEDREDTRRGVTHDTGAGNEVERVAEAICYHLKTEGLRYCLHCAHTARLAIAALSARVRDDEAGMMRAEREAIANEARRYASNYPQSSDGQNTFVMLAEWIERRSSAPEQGADDGWRPIESAPKNATAIIVSDGEKVEIGHWYCVQPQYGGFTHWRPLPSPPTPVSK